MYYRMWNALIGWKPHFTFGVWELWICRMWVDSICCKHESLLFSI